MALRDTSSLEISSLLQSYSHQQGLTKGGNVGENWRSSPVILAQSVAFSHRCRLLWYTYQQLLARTRGVCGRTSAVEKVVSSNARRMPLLPVSRTCLVTISEQTKKLSTRSSNWVSNSICSGRSSSSPTGASVPLWASLGRLSECSGDINTSRCQWRIRCTETCDQTVA